MKSLTHSACGLALVLALAALMPFAGGCGQSAKSASVTGMGTNQTPAAVATDTNSPPPASAAQSDAADQQLANASGTVISSPAGAAANNPQLGEVVKLAQAGVGESILTAYVTNSPSPFRLSSDDVVYLNDLGVPQTVINAMLQRDQYFNAAAAPAQTPALGDAPQSGYVNVAPAPLPQSADQNTPVVAEATPPLAEAVTPPPNPPADVVDDAEAAPNGSYSYFYDSLSPYGSWINIDGYGPCWQPTVVAANPGWQPYFDGGQWAYTDCGWCWVSDYSWGWAPFHYGRWFHNTRLGWCWAPDTIWGPAWVSWRYSGAYCGWAPLPPAACYRPGFGFTYLGSSVAMNFTFGLGPQSFVFVPLEHFHDRVLSRSRVDRREVDTIFRTTTVNNQLIRGPNNTLINRGVPVERVAAATHMEIRAVHIRTDVEGPGAAQFGRDGLSLSLYRPSLPTPRPTARSRLVGEGVQRDVNFNLQSHIDDARSQQSVNSANYSQPERRTIIPTPNTPAPDYQARTIAPYNNAPSQPEWRSTSARSESGVANQWPYYQRGQNFQSQQTPAVDNNRRIYMPQESAPRYPAAQQGQQREWPQQPSRQEQFRQDSRQEQFRQEEQPRQETAPRSYDQPRSSESRSASPAQSESSRQENNQNNNSGNNNGNGNGGSGGGRGH